MYGGCHSHSIYPSHAVSGGVVELRKGNVNQTGDAPGDQTLVHLMMVHPSVFFRKNTITITVVPTVDATTSVGI